jgi:hypothetical protein
MINTRNTSVDGSFAGRKQMHRRREQRGVALVLTIFGLLLLTGIAVAMMFSSDSETMIAVNYRDKNGATYAALSGLQEARDRLQPLNSGPDALSGFPSPLGPGPAALGPGPTALPTLGNNQVLYLINPANGELVQPWNAANKYFDTELCQEPYFQNVLGVAGKPAGVACTAVPAGQNWYTVVDNSATATNWQLTDVNGNKIPLDYKWVRVTLKADNMAPVYVQTSAGGANGTQVCWDTRYNQQLQLPAGAGTNCLGAGSGGSVTSVSLTGSGAGYSTSSPPTVTFSGGGGSGATATATVSTQPGAISSATLSNAGSGYTSAPSVTLVSPDGTGAALKATVIGSPVTALALSGGSNYCYQTGTTGLTVNFIPSPSPTGSDATGTVAMTGQACITGFTASGSCSSQKKNTVAISPSISGASGSGFSGTVTFAANGTVASTKVTNVGSYSGLPGGSQSITVAAGCNVTASFSGGIKISSVTLTNGGQYLATPTATITGPTPKAPSATQPTLSATWAAGASNGQLSGIQVTSAGTGYAFPSYTLAITGGGGSGAVGTAAASTTKYVSGITLTNGGSGYTSPPTVTISGTGAGATATAAIAGGQQLYLGPVYMLTSMAMTRTGSKSMAQMEVGVVPPTKFQLGGALTITGQDPGFMSPNSAPYHISGFDHAGTGVEPSTCNNTPGTALPAVGVANAEAQQCLIHGSFVNSCQQTVQCNGNVDPCTGLATPNSTGLGKPNNYSGAQSNTADVQVTPAANPDPSVLTQLVSDVDSTPGATHVGPPLSGPGSCTPTATTSCGSFTAANLPSLGSATNLQTIVVNGDLTLSGNPTGYGVLVVTGNMQFSGNFTWSGLVLVMGNASLIANGGGNGQITGAMYVGNSNGGTSNVDWSGGGGNGVYYDHCWADDLLNKFPAQTSSDPLQVLSSRILTF